LKSAAAEAPEALKIWTYASLGFFFGQVDTKFFDISWQFFLWPKAVTPTERQGEITEMGETFIFNREFRVLSYEIPQR